MNTLRLASSSIALLLATHSWAPALAQQAGISKPNRAVVLVSGGATSSPFTTPTQACKRSGQQGGQTYLVAGNTNTKLRQYLLEQGKQVYTAPVMDNWGPVQEPTDGRPGPFADCPIVLPESMTILSSGDINGGGERLARFLGYLHTKYGVNEVDLVGHSNGGLWSRSAIWVLKATNAPIRVRSLTTIGTPHTGSMGGRYTVGEITLSACNGSQIKNSTGKPFCETALKNWPSFADQLDKGLNRENTEHYLLDRKAEDGRVITGWNTAQGDALAGIPVTLLAGTYAENPNPGNDPKVWPYDGTVSRYSAWATAVPDTIIPWRTCWQGKLLHTIYQAEDLGVSWQDAITDHPSTLERVNQAINESSTALSKPNRQGCGT